MKMLEKYIDRVEDKVSRMGGKDDTFERICMALLEMAQIDSILMEADEDDKRSISLMGVRED